MVYYTIAHKTNIQRISIIDTTVNSRFYSITPIVIAISSAFVFKVSKGKGVNGWVDRIVNGKSCGAAISVYGQLIACKLLSAYPNRIIRCGKRSNSHHANKQYDCYH